MRARTRLGSVCGRHLQRDLVAPACRGGAAGLDARGPNRGATMGLGVPVVGVHSRGARMSVPARLSLQLPPMAHSASQGRHFVVETLQQWRLDSLVDSAALLSTEVITNAVLHARTPVTVSVERAGNDGVQISVADGSTFVPERRQATADSTNGRGLDLLD